MRILVLTNLFPPEFLGGYELGCAQMTAALSERGHDVHVLTSRSKVEGPERPGLIRRLELAPIYESDRAASSPPEVNRYFHLLSTVINPVNVDVTADVLGELEPDVVYLWNILGLGGIALLELLRRTGQPWVWHLMDCVPSLLCHVVGRGGAAALDTAGVFRHGSYIACSSRVAVESEQDGISLGERVQLLPNWTATPTAPPRRERHFAGGVLRVVSAVGTLGGHKGSDIVIGAVARLRELGYAEVTVDLFGREPDASLKALALRLGVADAVRFMGSRSQEELLPLYRDYDVFAFPTWAREPFGFAPLEAAAFGCVPLISDDCGIGEWLVDGVHCLKAERSVEGFAGALGEILAGDIALDGVARRAQALATGDLGVRTVAERVEACLAAQAASAAQRRPLDSDFGGLVRYAEGLLPTLLAEAG